MTFSELSMIVCRSKKKIKCNFSIIHTLQKTAIDFNRRLVYIEYPLSWQRYFFLWCEQYVAAYIIILVVYTAAVFSFPNNFNPKRIIINHSKCPTHRCGYRIKQHTSVYQFNDNILQSIYVYNKKSWLIRNQRRAQTMIASYLEFSAFVYIIV